MTKEAKRIVVLGAGYAGMLTVTALAGRARRRDDVSITVVNAGERFTERLRLHQVATGQQLAELNLRELLAGSKAEFQQGWVTGIDPVGRTVRIDDEREIGYDTLVYALGASADTGAVPGAAENAYSLDDAESFARRLAEMSRGNVVICGSGLTGIEAATEIAERFPHLAVTLLGRERPGAMLGPQARAYLDAALRRLGVTVRLGEIVKVRADGVDLAGGGTAPADAVLWTSGVRVSPLAAAAGLTTDGHGRIVTDGALRSVSHPEVYAVGDAAAIRQKYGLMHGTCQSGMPTGAHTAQQIVRQLDGKPVRRFRFGYLHVPISLGRHDAVIQFVHGDESPARARLTGRAAVWYKETVSSAPWPTFRRTLRFPRHTMLGWRR
ncbi:NAD(P)/FAD-dependent oxidoreductase [Actinoplanes awajinensis]|uniref:Pyridine nucleotide-disulfide oxidoreductase n=1 Tax=Actinoplanes awajinensis subsp. mycoplanecinus TaxID=135947 RepID=A0A101JJ30_9ACTN|nr:FAD-dependent oxidoreductase [Actinoplanes awajinensis]KUL27739.1 pyridine nucleotide-disulfide oxidoreductase [Actinoplanes awajinensis subsp. mycoplanecinus]